MQTAPQRFTNDVSSEYLQSLGHDQLGRPAKAIFRLASEGSRTRQGGTLYKGTSGYTITLDNGMKVGVGRVGDCIEYPDGSSSEILPGACEESSEIAVVGSLLSNGDEILDTLQDLACIVVYEELSAVRPGRTED